MNQWQKNKTIKHLYNISAKNKKVLKTDQDKASNMQYDGLIIKPFSGSFSFTNEPTIEEAFNLMNCLRPGHEYDIDSVKIEYVRELKPKEY